MPDVRDKSALSISISTSATMIGFSIAVATLLLTTQEGRNSNILWLVFFVYVLSVLANFLSMEFLTLSSRDDIEFVKLEKGEIYKFLKKNFAWTEAEILNQEHGISVLNALGSLCYGSAKVLMVIGLSLTCLVLLRSFELSVAILVVFAIGEWSYYIIRFNITKEGKNVFRTIGRILMILEIGMGFFLIVGITFYNSWC